MPKRCERHDKHSAHENCSGRVKWEKGFAPKKAKLKVTPPKVILSVLSEDEQKAAIAFNEQYPGLLEKLRTLRVCTVTSFKSIV
jgi:hypothetical protein